jgi:hypothetical protein
LEDILLGSIKRDAVDDGAADDKEIQKTAMTQHRNPNANPSTEEAKKLYVSYLTSALRSNAKMKLSLLGQFQAK